MDTATRNELRNALDANAKLLQAHHVEFEANLHKHRPVVQLVVYAPGDMARTYDPGDGTFKDRGVKPGLTTYPEMRALQQAGVKFSYIYPTDYHGQRVRELQQQLLFDAERLARVELQQPARS